MREWHSNYDLTDIVGSTKKQRNGNPRDEEVFSSQEWWIYFVRTVQDNEFDEKMARLKSKLSDADITLDGHLTDRSAIISFLVKMRELQ